MSRPQSRIRGLLSTQNDFVGSVITGSVISGIAKIKNTFVGSSNAIASFIGHMGHQFERLAGVISGVSTISVAVGSAFRSPAAHIWGLLSILKGSIKGAFAASASVSATVDVTKIIGGSWASSIGFSGAVYKVGTIAGLISAVANVSGEEFHMADTMVGSFDAEGNLTGDLIVIHDFTGFVSAITTISGRLRAGEVVAWINLDGIIFIADNEE